jgi:putative membrane protein
MNKAQILQRMLAVATLAMLFGSGGAYAQATGSAGASGSNSSATTGASGSSASAKVSRSDRKMMDELAQANISEIEAGKMAQSKTQNDQVKTFAQKMIDDHTKAQQDLQALAQQKGVQLPTEPDTKHKAAMKAMEALSADKFDAAYMKQGGLNDHKSTHKLLTQIESKAKDPDLKALAAKTRPVVDQHLAMAQDINKSRATGASSKSGSSASGTSGSSGSSSNTGSGK